ncbi:hypothetical protein, partial [Haloquadratum walsbyi]|uniref:hypothetical protein n=1 Tax=Haloquadratum walsbyi TaxID=293091 RepID=UPI001AD92BC1
ARFLSRLNAIPVRQPRTEQLVPNGTTSESKPTGQNAHLALPLGVRQYKCLRRPVSLPTHSVQPDDDGAVPPPYCAPCPLARTAVLLEGGGLAPVFS